jgi:retron-type reverse transcriptase
MDAKMAIRQAFWHVSDHGRSEVVDADLSDYFSSIPHGPLMRCVSRRVTDGTLLSVIKGWLTAPVVERDQRTMRCTTEAKDRHRGTPQGSPISPPRFELQALAIGSTWRLAREGDSNACDLVGSAPAS